MENRVKRLNDIQKQRSRPQTSLKVSSLIILTTITLKIKIDKNILPCRCPRSLIQPLKNSQILLLCLFSFQQIIFTNSFIKIQKNSNTHYLNFSSLCKNNDSLRPHSRINIPRKNRLQFPRICITNIINRNSPPLLQSIIHTLRYIHLYKGIIHPRNNILMSISTSSL